MKSIYEMTREELLGVRSRKHNEDIGKFQSLILIPSDKIHESGFRYIIGIAVKNDKPIAKVTQYSDVIAIGGIHGNNSPIHLGGLPEKVKPESWSIDFLPKSGMCRVFCGHTLSVGSGMSTLEVFSG